MGERENTQPKYARQPPEVYVTAALRRLNLSSTSARAFLGNRTSDSLIRLWRTGRRRPPQWAVDIFAKAIVDLAEQDLELARMVRQCAGLGRGKGEVDGRFLRAWQAHRAAQKEKARD